MADKIEYPCVMYNKSWNYQVRFTRHKVGTVVKGMTEEQKKLSIKPFDVGHFSDSWRMSAFEPVKKSRTLKT